MIFVAELTLILVWVRMLLCCGLGVWAWVRRVPVALRPLPATQVSVVVPAFNEEQHIEMTIRSLLGQDVKPWEIIVVDDGSTDGTAEIARRCLAGIDRARVIRLPVNLGKAEALNVGIRAASCSIVATIDADTRLEQGALGVALSTMATGQADAVAFYLDVDNCSSLFGSLQRHEYVASLNFERAGQDVIGAISILPGAATLYRRELLLSQGFSARSRTEDADLTLSLSRQGRRLLLAAEAVASTKVPDHWADLFAQRTRWITGHLQCCFLHAIQKGGAGWHFRAVTFPNFLLSTAMAPAGLLSLIAILAVGRTDLLHIEWTDAAVISTLLAYAQRGCAWLIAGKRRARLADFLLEPIMTGFVGTMCFLAALHALSRQALRRENSPAR